MSQSSDSTFREHRDEAVPFPPEDLFFSRTDDRGVIKGGNRVFRRLSGYDWNELIGAPHKVLRHKDMPKAIFWLMWNAIQAGHPIGAYIKNRTKDGRYYWVFAMVTASDGEYMSVRLKPTSPLLETVKGIYADVRRQELENGLSPEESAKVLFKALAALDFPDYASFASHALAQEIRSRDQVTQRPPSEQMSRFVDMLSNLGEIRREGEKVVKGFASIEGAPTNMRIQSTRIGMHGAPLGVISSNFDEIAGNIKTGIGPFVEGLKDVANHISRGLTINCSASLLGEVLMQFESSTDQVYSQETLAEMANLKDLLPNETAHAQLIMRDVLHQLTKFADACRQLKKTLSGLAIMRIMGEIESARIGDTKGSLNDITLQLKRFHAMTEGCLYKIEAARDRIESALRQDMERRKAA